MIALLVALACTPQDPERVFERDVVPALERSCASSSCHGVAPDADGESIDWSLLFFRIAGDGAILDPDEARTAALRAAVTDEDPAFSTLLRKPLSRAYGGLPHYGGDNWLTPDDPDYQAVYRWLALEEGGGQDTAPLDPLEQQFADTVQPALVGMGCTSGNCHGLQAAVPFRLDPGVGGRFSRAITRANHDAAATMLALDGAPGQSRLIRKALPLFHGGILHKGGNATFLVDEDDPRAEAMRQWACAERLERTGLPCPTEDEPLVEAIVFVRGPLGPEPVFDLDAWRPGSDLFEATLDGASQVTAIRDLTGALHGDPADVRDPAVSPDGTHVAFAMRRAADTGHRLWLLDRETGSAAPITDPPPGTSDRDPTFGPDGLLWFVSSRAGVVADGGDALDADLYTVDPATGVVTRRSWTPHVERKPSPFATGQEAGGQMSFTALRAVFEDQARAHPFRFPDGLKTEYHQHFGITPPETLFYDLREMPDGRYVTTIGELSGPWGGVRLGIVDRNFGPELSDPQATPSLPFYADPLTRLDPTSATTGTTGALYRDPAPLPDGRLLAAWAPGPLDLSATTSIDTAVAVLTLAEAPDGSGPRIADRTVLIDAPGVADHDPEPVLVRPEPKGSAEPAWDPDSPSGVLRHQGLPMIDAILANLPPSSTKTPRDDIAGVRLVEALPVGPDVRFPLPEAGPGATSTSLSPFGPARVLAEVPIEADGSFFVEVPAGIAFRIQALDADGMAIGHPHNRWFDVHPGQSIPQGVADEQAYGTLCAACHGASDGRPDHAFLEPDVMTTASLTLARYEDGDPRRPLAPDPCDDATRVVVDFVADVQPVLDRCAGCHADLADAPGEFFSAPYEHLLRTGLVVPGSARRSPLIEWLVGRELDAGGTAPSAPHAPISRADLRTLVRWIDLGAGFDGAPEAP